MNKRGFTLIELLAVIVILAIIALIAVPIVLNMIENARRSAAKSSAYGYIQAIDDNNELYEMNEDYDLNIVEIKGTNIPVSSINLKIKGKKPTSGEVTIDAKGRVSSATLCINNYTVTYNGTEAEVGSKGCSNSSSEPAPTPTVHKPSVTKVSGATHKGIVYMNPTDLTEECTQSNSVSTTGTKTGCMKFYIFDDSGDTYKMILDHNTTALVAYNTKQPYYVEYSQASIKSTVDSDTTGWVGSSRLITANEIATITNTTTYDGSTSKWFYFNGTGDNKHTQASSSQGDNEYAWLFDYTNGCESYGCNTADSSTSGYWTSSSVSDRSGNAWSVHSRGRLNYILGSSDVTYGVRPVITINKSVLD